MRLNPWPEEAPKPAAGPVILDRTLSGVHADLPRQAEPLEAGLFTMPRLLHADEVVWGVSEMVQRKHDVTYLPSVASHFRMK